MTLIHCCGCSDDRCEGIEDPSRGQDDWRCECGDLNRGHEAFCYRCGAGQPDADGASTVAKARALKLERCIALLRECQSALTGPAELRQRIEDEIDPRDPLTYGVYVSD